MKKIFKNKIFQVICPVVLFVALIFSSCVKDNDGSPTGKPSAHPTVTGFIVDSGANGTVAILQGSGLSSMASIVFDKNKAPATFNPNFNTDNSLVFRVPDTAAGGRQQVVFTNTIGQSVSISFKVIALASVNSASSYSFTPGETTILTGRFLDDVTKVVYTGTTQDVTIVSKTKTTLTLQFTATTASTVKFTITNASGSVDAPQEYVNANQSYVVFRDTYGPGVSDGSWGPASISTTQFISGTASAQKSLPKGNWWVAGFNVSVPYDPAYKYLSFWVKGGLIDHTLYLTGNKRPGGFGNSDQTTPLLFPANQWTYFKLPIGPLNLWGTSPTGVTFTQFGWWIKGPDNDNEMYYFDDVFLIK